MRVADITNNFGPVHAVRAVGFRANVVRVERFEITRPAATGIEFGVRSEQGRSAAYATVNARLLVIPVIASERLFRGFLLRHCILQRRKPAPQIIVLQENGFD